MDWSLPGVLLWPAAVFLGAVSLLPQVRTGFWAVRIGDFPRTQLLCVSGIMAACSVWAAIATDHPYVYGTLFVVFALIMCVQAFHIIHFSPLWRKEVPHAADDRGAFRLMIANLDYENKDRPGAASVIEEIDADMLLFVEIDAAWERALDDVAAAYPHRLQEVLPEGRGIALWSRPALHGAEVRRLVDDERPSLRARVEPEGAEAFEFVGLHPVPPGLDNGEGERHDSRQRDAELVMVAKEVADASDRAWVVAGDMNDVAWSHTTRLFKRLSGLLDPRVGRGLFSTYHARYPFARYPLDHVFVSEGFGVVSMRRVRVPGSDHLAIVLELVLKARRGTDPEPKNGDGEEAQKMVSEGRRDAEENG